MVFASFWLAERSGLWKSSLALSFHNLTCILTFQITMVTTRIGCFNTKLAVFCPHGVFILSTWFSQATNFVLSLLGCVCMLSVILNYKYNVFYIFILYVPCIILQCVDIPARCTNSYKKIFIFHYLLNFFGRPTRPSSGEPSSKLYHAFGTFLQANLAATWL